MEKVLTAQDLYKMQPGEVFATGIAENSPGGIYMTNNYLNRKLLWIAKRGQIEDWAIYINWADMGYHFVLKMGDKVASEKNIKKLVPCDDDAFSMYRY